VSRLRSAKRLKAGKFYRDPKRRQELHRQVEMDSIGGVEDDRDEMIYMSKLSLIVVIESLLLHCIAE
jgi:hypothetical protein